MEIKRDRYLNKLISFMWDGQVKVITGIRRCGKSYLLRNLFRTYLLGEGVPADHILSFELDLTRDIRYRNPLELANRVREIVENQREQFYLFVDEIQMSDEVPNPYNPDGKKITFYDALNDLKSLPNLDIYVTGSNSRMLSSDILTEFRGRSDEIRVHPLSFAEYYSAVGGDKEDAFENYAFYGGMPLILSRPTDAAKMQYLRSLFSEVYLKDIVERKKVKREDVLSDILDLLCSSVGSLTNPTRVADTINSKQKRSGENTVSPNTVKAYMDHLADAFLFTECKRWDVKGKNYFDYPNKYYCDDIGLRNARIGFRQQEMTHIMENILYNELRVREFDIDVGVVEVTVRDDEGKNKRVQYEVDFVANRGSKRYYIQSAFAIPDEEKRKQEIRPFTKIQDSFKKIVVVREDIEPWHDENGILFIGIEQFLLDESAIDI